MYLSISNDTNQRHVNCFAKFPKTLEVFVLNTHTWCMQPRYRALHRGYMVSHSGQY